MSAIASYLAERGIERIADSIFNSIIKGRSHARAVDFYDQFTDTISKGDEQDLAAQLQRIDNDPNSAELLFSAYKSAVFAKSAILGPRYIAFLTGTILNDCRKAEPDELVSMSAAEILDDIELVEFSKFILQSLEDSSIEQTGEQYRVELESHQSDSNWRFNSEVTNTINLQEYLGRWAVRCQTLGLLHQSSITTEQDYEADCELRRDEPGTITTTSFSVEFGPESILLANGVRKISIGTPFYW